MLTNILNLPLYQVEKIQEEEHDYHIAASVLHIPKTCIHCRSTSIRGFGRREQLIKDLPMHGKRVGIYVLTSRYQCINCPKTFYDPLPDVDEKRIPDFMTAAF